MKFEARMSLLSMPSPSIEANLKKLEMDVAMPIARIGSSGNMSVMTRMIGT